MVRKTLRLLALLLFFGFTALGVWMLMPSEKDAERYQDLLYKVQSIRSSKRKKDPYVAMQHREGVIKDFYYCSGKKQLLQMHMASQRSRLVFEQKPETMDILEHLEGLTCVIQTELFYVTPDGKDVIADSEGKPMQSIFYITASKAIYDYNRETLLVDHPVIVECRAEGHRPPETYDPTQSLKVRAVADHAEIFFGESPCTFAAAGNVLIDYGKSFSAKGEQASYHSGALLLCPGEKCGYCTLSTGDGLSVKMDKGIYTTDTQELVLIQPNGEMPLDGQEAERLYFQARQLLWDDSSLFFTLIDDVTIKAPHAANLVNNDRVSIEWKQEKGKKVVSQITSLGKSELQRFDGGEEASYIVKDEGVTHFDIKDGRVVFSSYPDHEVHYCDRLGHIFGKEFMMDVVSKASAFAPGKIFMSGEVKMIAGVAASCGEVQGAAQYVLADALTLDPDAKTLVMESAKNSRVLFCDRMNRMQMSAPKLLMYKKSGQEKPTVKGIGDVRFRLVDHEIEQMKKRFHFNEGR